MAKRVKKYRPTEQRTDKPFRTFPEIPLMPKQPSLEGFSTPAIDEMEAAMEQFKEISEDVKQERDRLKTKLDAAQNKLIATLVKHGQKAIVINGLSGEIVDTIKAKVKGKKKDRVKDGEKVRDVAGAIPLTKKESADFKIKVGDHLVETGAL